MWRATSVTKNWPTVRPVVVQRPRLGVVQTPVHYRRCFSTITGKPERTGAVQTQWQHRGRHRKDNDNDRDTEAKQSSHGGKRNSKHTNNNSNANRYQSRTNSSTKGARYSKTKPTSEADSLKQKEEMKAMKDNTEMRLAKYIARSSITSRRGAEALIEQGRVKVDGVVVTTPAYNVSDANEVIVDDKPIVPDRPRLFLHYKRVGIIVSTKDAQGRPTLSDVLAQVTELPTNLKPVGRLDFDSEGLILLTNDGNLSRYLEHPSSDITRAYRVKVTGEVRIHDQTSVDLQIDKQALAKLSAGITFGGITYGPILVEVAAENPKEPGARYLTVQLQEGKNREIRRVMAHLGLRVRKLIRIAYGPYKLKDMQPGDLQEAKLKDFLYQYVNPSWVWKPSPNLANKPEE